MGDHMKLNKNGWGMAQLIAGICVILVFLLIATFFTLKLNAWLEDNGVTTNTTKETNTNTESLEGTAKSYYVSLSNELITATNEYIADEGLVLEKNSTIQIQLDLLVNHGYIETIKDYYTKNICTGYTLTYLDSDYIKEINAYIKCDNYTTEGYTE